MGKGRRGEGRKGGEQRKFNISIKIKNKKKVGSHVENKLCMIKISEFYIQQEYC